MSAPVLTALDARGVATVTFNRPEVNNAYNGALLDGVHKAMDELAGKSGVRVLVLKGNGRHFQAGADLTWVKGVRASPQAANIEASRITALAIDRLNRLPIPVIALIQGGCFGGGTGIVAGCDIVIASEDAIFSITEARWGVMAGPIFPQLNAAMGEHNVRRYALTCERFGAVRAREMGLVDEVCAPGRLDDAAAPIIEAILAGGPNALREAKRLIIEVGKLAVSDALAETLALQHALKRQTDEAEEGLKSFVEKRSPSWYPGRG